MSDHVWGRWPPFRSLVVVVSFQLKRQVLLSTVARQTVHAQDRGMIQCDLLASPEWQEFLFLFKNLFYVHIRLDISLMSEVMLNVSCHYKNKAESNDIYLICRGRILSCVSGYLDEIAAFFNKFVFLLYKATMWSRILCFWRNSLKLK